MMSSLKLSVLHVFLTRQRLGFLLDILEGSDLLSGDGSDHPDQGLHRHQARPHFLGGFACRRFSWFRSSMLSPDRVWSHNASLRGGSLQPLAQALERQHMSRFALWPFRHFAPSLLEKVRMCQAFYRPVFFFTMEPLRETRRTDSSCRSPWASLELAIPAVGKQENACWENAHGWQRGSASARRDHVVNLTSFLVCIELRLACAPLYVRHSAPRPITRRTFAGHPSSSSSPYRPRVWCSGSSWAPLYPWCYPRHTPRQPRWTSWSWPSSWHGRVLRPTTNTSVSAFIKCQGSSKNHFASLICSSLSPWKHLRGLKSRCSTRRGFLTLEHHDTDSSWITEVALTYLRRWYGSSSTMW